MTDMDEFERQFEDRVRAFASVGVRAVDSSAVARAVAAGHPRSHRAWSAVRWFGSTFDGRAWAIVLALGLLVALLGGALLVGAGLVPSTLLDTRDPVRPSQDQPAVVGPSPIPSPTPPPASGFPRTTGVWIATGSMGSPRSGHTAVRLLDGRVLVVGGYPGDEPDDALTSAELYDPNSGTWSATGSMLRPHGGFPATLLRDGRVLVGDVDDPGADTPVAGAEVYDPASGTWTVTGKMVTPDKGSARCCTTAGCSSCILSALRSCMTLRATPGSPRARCSRTSTNHSRPTNHTRPSCCPMARCSWWAAATV